MRHEPDPDAPFPDVIGLGLNSQQSSTLKIAQALQRGQPRT
jgi:hypothetical protein